MNINIGISEIDRRAAVQELSKVLADSYTLYLKTQNFHWNVTGPMFHSLHHLFEKQYLELAEAVDLIAERIRALGAPAPASYREFSRLTTIPEPESIPAARDMIQELVEGHEILIRAIRKALPIFERAHDEATVDLVTERIRHHEKTAWMLRSTLEERASERAIFPDAGKSAEAPTAASA